MMIAGNPTHRFWSKVAIGDVDQCWDWKGSCQRKGYGQFTIRPGVIGKCHRMSWEFFYGSIPDGLWVLHKCDRTCCINPFHLFLGTAQDNADDMMAKGRGRKAIGVKCGAAKLNDDIVRDIRFTYSMGFGYKKLSKLFGISVGHARWIALRKIWKHVD